MNQERPVVIITGGSQGLGLSLAQLLLQGGFAVAICARSAAGIEAAASELGYHEQLFAETGDVTDAAFRSHFIERVGARFGRIDALVNNASTLGDVPMPTLLETTATNIRQVFETNVVAPLLWLQTAWPWLSQAPAALVIGITSDAATEGYENWGVYGSSKAALDLSYRTLSNELPGPVTVLTVDPGEMDTAMHHAALPGETGMPQPATAAASILPLFAHLRFGTKPALQSGTRLTVQNGSLVGGGWS